MIRTCLLTGCAVLAAMLAPTGVAFAQTDSRASADVSATAGYSSNPFTVGSGSNSSGTAVVTVNAAPRYELLTPRSTFTISADANLQQYLERYGRNDSYSAAVDYAGRPSEHVTANAHIDLSSAVLGTFDSYLPLAATTPLPGTAVDTGSQAVGGATATDTGTVQPIAISPTPLIPYTDVGLYGTRSRRRSIDATGNLGFTLSPRDVATVSAYVQASRYGNGVNTIYNGDYTGFGGSAGYQRRLSSALSIGATGSASRFDYRGATPDSQVYSIQATASARLSDRWSADGGIGVSFVDGGGQRSTRNTSLSGNVNVCRRGSYSLLCAQAARQVSATGFAGAQYVTSAGLTWNRRIDERQNVSLGGSYSNVGGDAQVNPGGFVFKNQYAQATAGYNRRLGRRLSVVASLNYRELLGNNSGNATDYGGQLGLSYHLGDRR